MWLCDAEPAKFCYNELIMDACGCVMLNLLPNSCYPDFQAQALLHLLNVLD